MARIRSIKPEFWSSPNLPSCPWARLLFIAMWNWADDNGVGEATERALLGFAFPNDENIGLVELRRMLVEIRRVFGVEFYTVEGRPYYAIPSWEKHQKFDRRSKGKHPGPDQAETLLYPLDHAEEREARGNPTSTRRDSVAGTGEQGNRGTGEQLTLAQTSGSSVQHQNRFDEFWEAYPRKVGKQKARTDYQRATKRADEQTIIDGAHRLAGDPNLPEAQYIPHPTTWLNRDGWEDEPLPPRADAIEPHSRAQQALELARKYAQAEQEQEYHQLEAQ